jgi:protein-tyrosine phosphatase
VERRVDADGPGFVDVHTHVVPSGDDGAQTVAQGLELCRVAHEAGTRLLFATPHAHAPWDSYPRSGARERIFDAAFPVLREATAAWGLELRRGWEVFPSEVANGNPEDYRLEGTRAVLVEFPGSWLRFAEPLAAVSAAGERIEAAGLVPVLAHPERCSAVRADPRAVRRFAERGWLLCPNAGSLLGEHGAGAERAAWELLDEGLVALAASDAHGAARPPRLDRAYAAIAARHGRERALALFDGSGIPWA